MKRFAFAAVAALMATVSFASVASADWRDDGNDDWRRNAQHRDHGDRDGQDWRHADGRDRDRSERHHDDWRRDRWRDDHRGRHDGWRDEGYWGGPRVVVRPWEPPRYCFVKKIVRYDEWGDAYVRRVRVCP